MGSHSLAMIQASRKNSNESFSETNSLLRKVAAAVNLASNSDTGGE